VRIVLDTNIVMSALLWRGPPYQLLRAIREQPAVQLCSSPALLAELTDVLTRPAASRQLAHIGATALHLIADYIESIELHEPTDIPRIARDPDDDHVLACALAANAQLIVSGDRDLLELGIFRQIPILAAREALDREIKREALLLDSS
jgi:putative PIN family toxin of toxin-antitoxin system